MVLENCHEQSGCIQRSTVDPLTLSTYSLHVIPCMFDFYRDVRASCLTLGNQ
jgi:hypothetical protein